MTSRTLDTDYLIVGSGAIGLAFADTLVAETDAQVTIVDRHGKPGGHWNDAYPFVTLHQPSSFYGVNSLELATGLKDAVGLNKGLYDLASGPEVSGYFERVMNHRLLPTGRVRYLPLTHHLGDGLVESLLSGARTDVTVRRRIVDTTVYAPKVPSTHTPRFEIGAGVRVVPPNALPGLWQHAAGGEPARRFVVLGAGKTAMDACVWLLQSGAEPQAITWVVPRDSWLVNRLTTQNAPEFFHESIGGQADQMEALGKADSVDDLFLRLEACGAMLRVDRERMPGMFHFATVSQGEIDVLRTIRDVVRLGRVRALSPDRMTLEHGSVAVAPRTLFVDCTASATDVPALQPVFQGRRIMPQLVRAPLIAFSAALTAYVEAHYDDDAQRNRLCTPVPFPHSPRDFPETMLANMQNQFAWGQDKALRDWMRASRLDGFGRLMAGAAKDDPAKQAVIGRLKEYSGAAMANLPKLIAAARA